MGAYLLLARVRPAHPPADDPALADLRHDLDVVQPRDRVVALGRWSLPAMLFLPIPFEIVSGNVHLIYAAAIVLGFRASFTWALPILTKVTPGIGLAWFAVRREWRQLGIALGVTALIVAVSFALDPSLWRQWFDIIAASLEHPGHPGLVPPGLAHRSPADRPRGCRGRRAHRPGMAPADRGHPGVARAVAELAGDPGGVLAASVGGGCSGPAVRRPRPTPGCGRSAVMAVARAVPARRWDGPLLLLVAGVLLASALVALPVLLKETTRDWTAYEQAAGRLATGQPLYIWELATEDDEYYLYPPGMAVVWSIAGSPQLLAAVKVLALLAVGILAPLVVANPSRQWVAAVFLAAGALVWPPNLYDLVLGNVMALYVGATAVAIAGAVGWARDLSASSLRWQRSPRSSRSLFGWRSGTHATRRGPSWWRSWFPPLWRSSWVPARYVEYLEALPRMTTLATSFTGNLGLVTLSPAIALVGLVLAWVIAAFAGARMDERRGAASRPR